MKFGWLTNSRSHARLSPPVFELSLSAVSFVSFRECAIRSPSVYIAARCRASTLYSQSNLSEKRSGNHRQRQVACEPMDQSSARFIGGLHYLHLLDVIST